MSDYAIASVKQAEWAVLDGVAARAHADEPGWKRKTLPVPANASP